MAEQELGGHIQRRCELADLVGRGVGRILVLQFPDIALARFGELGQLLKAQFLLLAQRAQLVTQGGRHRSLLSSIRTKPKNIPPYRTNYIA